jgi:hypothetical protein
MIARRFIAIVLAAGVLGPAFARPLPALAEAVRIPLTALGYRDGVTVSGVAPSVTFDLPRYASLRAATLELDVHASAAVDPSSTVAIAVDGRTTVVRTLQAIGDASRLVVPLPIPAATQQTFAITVRGALRGRGNACDSRDLFLRIGRESAIVVTTDPGGSVEAFFRDYRGALDVAGSADDPAIAAVPYRVDRLEPWHRIDATLVSTPRPGHRTLVFTRAGTTSRDGDVLRITPAAFAALPMPRGQSPTRRDGSIAFGDLRQNLGTARGLGDLAFDVPLAASVVGGVPQRLRVHVDVAHSALPAAVSGTLQVLVNGILVGARDLGRDAATQSLDVAVPASAVGPSNDLRVLVATSVPPGACAGNEAITASLLGSSSFRWGSVERRAPTIESFLTALHGRVVVLVTPAFTREAFHVMTELGKMNASITQLDVVPFAGTVPDGYDAAIVFAPPTQLRGLGLPIRPRAAAFDVIDPTADTSVLHAGSATTFALLQLGVSRGTPLLAISYHGAPSAMQALEAVDAAQLATQVAVTSVVDARGVTAYDIGEKLRVTYAGDETVEQIWARVRIGVALALVILILAGAMYAARRLTGASLR